MNLAFAAGVTPLANKVDLQETRNIEDSKLYSLNIDILWNAYSFRNVLLNKTMTSPGLQKSSNRALIVPATGVE